VPVPGGLSQGSGAQRANDYAADFVPAAARLIAAMSIFFIVIIASNARFAA
jgi:hypothetical protein